ncbi:MAG: DsrE family protein [Ferruginibacter sp.]
MYKKIAPIIILLVIIAFSAASQMSDENNHAEKQMPFTEQGFSENSKAVNLIKHRVVIQLSSSDTLVWRGLMNNIRHLKAGWGDSVAIEVIAHGPGIEMLMKAKTTQQKKIAEFREMGVVFAGCENTLRERNIPKEAIIPEAGFVPMGIGEIIMKQEQGWSYIKAGF